MVTISLFRAITLLLDIEERRIWMEDEGAFKHMIGSTMFYVLMLLIIFNIVVDNRIAIIFGNVVTIIMATTAFTFISRPEYNHVPFHFNLFVDIWRTSAGE